MYRLMMKILSVLTVHDSELGGVAAAEILDAALRLEFLFVPGDGLIPGVDDDELKQRLDDIAESLGVEGIK